MIPKEIYEKYNMASLESELILFGDSNQTRINWYKSFLSQTDYICNKIVEGVSTKENYAKELEYRQAAREEIGKLEAESKTASII